MNPAELREYKRFYIIGTSGSGKTTLAKALSHMLGCTHIELDSIFHQPNWTPLELEEFRHQVSERLIRDQWVIEGNYAGVRDLVLARTEVVIWLRYPMHIPLGRVTKRTFRRLLSREELWNGNKETLRNFFSKENMILWVLNTHKRREREFDALMAERKLKGQPYLILTSPLQVEELLQSL